MENLTIVNNNDIKSSSEIFKKTGIILIIVGVLDIFYMMYAIINMYSYSSSLNIFAVIAGIFLLKENIRLARYIRWLCMLELSAIGAMAIFLPFIMPVDLLIVQLKLHFFDIMISFSGSILLIVITIWVYRQLSSEPILDEYKKAGYKTGIPQSAILIGVSSVIALVFLLSIFLGGESGTKALTLANEKLGPDYKYFVSSIRTFNGNHHATVIAYKEDEIKEIAVNW